MRLDPCLELADCQAIADAALNHARLLGGGVSLAVVDGGGQLLLALRLDGASPVSAEAALAKARLAALSGKSSASFEDAINGPRPALAQLTTAISQPAAAMAGGLPLVTAGRCIGAIGISGRTPAEDGATAAAGVAAFEALITTGSRPRILGFGFTCRDAGASASFYQEHLGFQRLAEDILDPGHYGILLGLPQARLKRVHLALGQEQLELLEVIDPGPGQRAGRPLPTDSRSCDLWFQHLCLVVSSLDAAGSGIEALIQNGQLSPISQAPQRLPDSNPSAGGIVAFKFRDPDGHALELLQFPEGRGEARWHQPRQGGIPQLGIDHSAIAISDPARSGSFYGELLGLRVGPPGLNVGPEQDRLDGLDDTRVSINPYRTDGGPGLEGLAYRPPNTGRAMPSDHGCQDLSHWRTRLAITDLEGTVARVTAYGGQVLTKIVTLGAEEEASLGIRRGVTVLDPDGHSLQLVET
jgi:uncharacterized protein GlcG (DUF336 family)/catechol 2,3-dioxygenase-like lactoylglutathione lyase family enzyme